jgi:hypothetical protein
MIVEKELQLQLDKLDGEAKTVHHRIDEIKGLTVIPCWINR